LSASLRSDWRDPKARISLPTALKVWLVARHGLL
jgi:hypothetical protein